MFSREAGAGCVGGAAAGAAASHGVRGGGGVPDGVHLAEAGT